MLMCVGNVLLEHTGLEGVDELAVLASRLCDCPTVQRARRSCCSRDEVGKRSGSRQYSCGKRHACGGGGRNQSGPATSLDPLGPFK